MKMLAKRTVQLHGQLKSIRLEYSDNETYFGDTDVVIYDTYKISLVLTDDCGAVIGEKVFFPKRGDMIIFRPNEVHFGRFPRSSEYQFLSILIPVDFFDSFHAENRKILLPFLDDSEDRIHLIRLPETERERLIRIAEELLELMNSEPALPYFDILVFAKLIEALDLCNRYYLQQKEIPYSPPVPPLIPKTMRTIEQHFPDFIGLNALAEQCGCSVTYLTQTFRKYTGKSIHNYLTQRRLEHARRLLKGGLSVNEACYQSGFSDCSGFIALFRKHFHMTPGQYKKGHCNGN